MARKDVLVRTNAGAVPPSQEAVILSREAGDTIRWVSECDQPATIVFASNEGSPFKSKIYKLKAKGRVHSGSLSRKSHKGGGAKVYKYTIMGGSANNDPIIIVTD